MGGRIRNGILLAACLLGMGLPAGAEESRWRLALDSELNLEWDSNVRRTLSNQSQDQDMLVRLFVEGEAAYSEENPLSFSLRYQGGFKKYFEERDEDLAIQQAVAAARWRNGSHALAFSNALKIKTTRDGAGEFLINTPSLHGSHSWSPEWISAISIARQDANFENRVDDWPADLKELLNRIYDSQAWNAATGLIRRFSQDTFIQLEYGFEHRQYPDYQVTAGQDGVSLVYATRRDLTHRIGLSAEYFDTDREWLIRLTTAYSRTASSLEGFDHDDAKFSIAWASPVLGPLYADLAANFDFRQYSDQESYQVRAGIYEYILTEQESERLSSLSAQLTWQLEEGCTLTLEAAHYFQESLYQRTLAAAGFALNY